MKSKRFWAISMAVMVTFAACACVSANADATETTAETAQTESVKGTGAEAAQENNEEFLHHFPESEKESLYEAIKEYMLANYFEPKEIDPQNFAWPKYENTEDRYYDEDNSWAYLQIILSNYAMFEEKYSTRYLQTSEPLNEENIELMNCIFDSVIEWNTRPENSDISIMDTVIFLFPYYDTLVNDLDWSAAE